MVCDPRSCAHPKSQRCTAYTGMSRISWASSRAARPASRRSVRSGQRCSDRRCAAADGGEDAESAGLVLADEAFQGGCPIWCDPRSCAHLKSSAGHRMWLVCLTSRVAPTPRIPFAPCDPASGSRTGGALRRALGWLAERPAPSIRPADRGPAVRRCGGWGEGWSRSSLGSCSLTRRFREAAPYGVTHGAVPT